jgi:hypothetical protein
MTTRTREVEDLSLQIDTAPNPIIYIGEAPAGVPTSAALWRIQRLDVTAGIIILWADGNPNYDNIWDNRAALTYT